MRDVGADYVDLFGHESEKVAAIAVMTDMDNRRTACVSYFWGIYFSETGAGLEFCRYKAGRNLPLRI